MSNEQRRLDPLFAGLAREARQFGLPLAIFLALLIGGMLLMMVFVSIDRPIAGLVFVVVLYGILTALTYEEDRGVTYFMGWAKRRMSNDTKHFGGISYDTSKKHIGSMNFKNVALARKEKMESQHIPYKRHVNDHMIELLNGDVLTTLKVSGFKYATESYRDLATLKNYRDELFQQLGSRFVPYVHYIRTRVTADEHKPIQNEFSDTLMQTFSQKANKSEVFVNDVYVTLVVRKKNPNISPAEKFKALVTGVGTGVDELVKELREATAKVMKELEDATPVRLKTNGKHCEILTFLSYILNLDKTAIPLFDEDICNYLSYTRKVFKNDGQIQFNCADGSVRGAYIYGLPTSKYPEGTDHTMLDSFLNLQQELIISMSFMKMDKRASVTLTRRKQNQLMNTQDDSISQVVGISEALDDLASGRTLNGIFNMTVMVHAASADRLKKAVSEVSQAFNACNMTAKREDLIAEPAYFAQLPGNMHMNCRPATINTKNFAGFASLHNTQIGSKYGNHWGECVTQLVTTSNTPYYFNWHQFGSDLGHTRIIGPTGGGKSATINFLIAATQKYEPYIFHFDFEHGSEVYVLAMGGKHVTLMPTQKTGWNPLLLPDNDYNRGFLYNLFYFMAGGGKPDANGNEIELSPPETRKIKHVVEQIYDLKPELRQMKHIMPLFGMSESGNLRERLDKWANDGALANVFDNETDNFSIDGAKVFGFEMKYIIDQPEFLKAAMMYIFHCIAQAMKQDHPFMVIVEELQRFIEGESSKQKIKEISTTYRKLGGFLVAVSPTPEILIEDANLRQQFATSIYFPNPEASHKTYCGDGGLGCTEKEFEWVTNTSRFKREFLIKNERDSVTCKLDLSDMPDFMKVLSGNEKKAAYVRNLIERLGTHDPKVWLPVYYKEYNPQLTALDKKDVAA